MAIQSTINENNFRKVFDYRIPEQLEIDAEFGRLTTEQRERLNEAMKQIQQETAQEAAERALNWIYETAVPVLKRIAERSGSLLTVEAQENNLLIMELKNDKGLYLLGEDAALKSVLNLAAYVELSVRECEAVLSLTFDGEKLEI